MTDLLNAQTIIAHTGLAHRSQLPQILTFNALSSTNDYLLKNAAHFGNEAVFCLAEQQTAGRGRLGRTWVSPSAANIYASLLWHFHLPRTQLAGLNIVTGISIVEAIQSITSAPDLMLKWPNDVYWRDKKLAGILIDIAGESNGISSVIIGIGINVQMPDSAANDIQKPWVDLNTITGKTISRNQLAGALVERLFINLQQFQRAGTSEFCSKWKALDYLSGKQISITTGVNSSSGIAKGINEHGQLLLDSAGIITPISAGEASVLLL
jgi:BirA family biotin operon repressor/biotin-[acetyl-CoA-carboxylase] ligase